MAVERPNVIKVDDEENAVRPLATSAHVGFSLEDHQLLACRNGASRLGSVYNPPVKKRKPSSSAVTTGRQTKKVTRANSDEEVNAAAENIADVDEVCDVTPGASGALQAET